MGYIRVITHLLTFDPNFQRDIQLVILAAEHRHFQVWLLKKIHIVFFVLKEIGYIQHICFHHFGVYLQHNPSTLGFCHPGGWRPGRRPATAIMLRTVSLGCQVDQYFYGYSTNTPLTYPPRNKGLIAGLPKGNQWLIRP